MKKRHGFRKFLHIYLIVAIIAIAGIAVCAYGKQLTSTGTIDFNDIPENVILMSPNGNIPKTGSYSSYSCTPICSEAQGHYEQKLITAAWDEQVQTGTKTVIDKPAWDETMTHYVCTECGATKQK